MRKTIKWYVAIAACAGLLACSAFLAVRFNDYLKANDQGICWLEGRKVPMEEMRIRALKTFVLEHKRLFDQHDDEMERLMSYWRIIKQDYDGDTLFKLSLTFPLFLNGHSGVYKEIIDPILKVEDFDQDLLQSDAFYRDIIKNNYMLASSYDSPILGSIYRTKDYRLFEKNEFDKENIFHRNLTDRINGFGLHYFYIQSMAANYWNYRKHQSASFGIGVYAINNCGNSYYLISTSGKNITETAEKSFSFDSPYLKKMQPERSFLTVFIEFFQGI